MSVTVRLKLNEQAFRQLTSDNGYVGVAARRAAGVVRDDAKRIITSEGRVDTGALRQDVKVVKLYSDPNRGAFYQVRSDLPYSLAQHEGVPGPVVPRRARVLRFKPKGSGVVIFRPRTRGFVGIKFLTRALERLTVRDFLGG